MLPELMLQTAVTIFTEQNSGNKGAKSTQKQTEKSLSK